MSAALRRSGTARRRLPRAWRAPFACALLLALAACRLTINMDVEETVEQVEQRRFAAMVAQDVATLEPMLAEELHYGHSTGEVENKAQLLETVRSGRLRYEAFDVEQREIRTHGDVALVTGRCTVRARRGDQALVLDLVFSDAYVRRAGRWQLVSWQSTRVP